MKTQVSTTINDEPVEFLCEAHDSLLGVLRDTLSLTGAKEGCNNGNCGACSVIMNGVLVNSCCVLAVETEGARVNTIEGLAPSSGLHPMQIAFWEKHGLQCGFCTPGMILTAVDLLQRNPHPSDEEIRHGLEGNICRCTGYENIVRAVKQAAGAQPQQEA